jgi:hypothetical protein
MKPRRQRLEKAERVGIEYARVRLFELGQIIHVTKCETVLNLKTAKVLGLDVSAAVLPRADRVIEFR